MHQPRMVADGHATLEEARQAAAEAITYALEGQSAQADDEDQVGRSLRPLRRLGEPRS